MWNSNKDPWSDSELAEWYPYSDLESMQIEEAYQKKLPNVLLDNYHIDLENLVQISNYDKSKQRVIKRVVDGIEKASIVQTRFTSKRILPSAPFIPVSSDSFIAATSRYFGYHLPSQNPLTDDVALRMAVEKAAEGLLIEGKLISKGKDAEWIAKELLKVKDRSRDDIHKCCGRLHSMESFLYKELRTYMQLVGDEQHEAVWKNKIETLGPFAFLLAQLGKHQLGSGKRTVYMGANLSDDHIEKFRQKCIVSGKKLEWMKFPAFTQTCQNKAVAEHFGNVIFVIDVSGQDGYDLSPISEYPNEQEYLILPDFSFAIRSCVFDDTKNKWNIHLSYARTA